MTNVMVTVNAENKAPFYTVLVANRGEIAVRIIRTAKQEGYRTVAVYSDADKHSLHVKEADLAVAIGPAAVGQSYLNSAAIIDAARKSGADAVHPGYGLLSENAEFARACTEAGLIFIGPDADTIELMGNKRLSKHKMLAAGVPCIPGYQDSDQSDQRLYEEILQIGLPVMIKAAAGGGGRGMRLVHNDTDIDEAVNAARLEAQSAFGSAELILEKALLQVRHIEVQIFADCHGNVVALGERDCSIQRRHQKIVEEAPSSFVDESLRRQLCSAAVEAAKACQYCGAGTVEFLVDADKHFYFLEMNTRIQVEHPVTEMITGIDLVAWQFLVAQGEPLPLTQYQISQALIETRGHAIEVRLYAEDPVRDFIPQTGQVLYWHQQLEADQRCDHMITENMVVSSFYDPMLAKLVAFGSSREQARRRLLRLIDNTCLLGVNHNLPFLKALLQHPDFISGNVTTDFIETRQPATWLEYQSASITQCWSIAALILFLRYQSLNSISAVNQLRLNLPVFLKLACESAVQSVSVERTYPDGKSDNEQSFRCTLVHKPSDEQSGNLVQDICIVSITQNMCIYQIDGVRQRAFFVLQDEKLYLNSGGHTQVFINQTYHTGDTASVAGTGQLAALMDGAIVDVLVKPQDPVKAGDTIMILEAMKMEHPIKSDIEGTVTEIYVSKGDQVSANQLLSTVVNSAQPE